MPTDTELKLHEPTFGEEEIEAVVEVLRSTQVTSGARVREMETLFGEHAVMCNSGSSANLLAIATLCNPLTYGYLRPGDEVIVPALCWSTSVWPLVQHGLVPVIVDINPVTLNIDPDAVARAVGPRTRAILAVHVYGNPCDMRSLCEIANEHDLFLIEDGCEALGMAREQQYQGNLITYSFYFSHHITTLEGGLTLFREERHAEVSRMLRAHGWVRDMRDPSVLIAAYPDIDPKFLFVNAGYNLRASEVAAAMGLVQMRKLAGFVAARIEVATRLQEIFHPHREHVYTQMERQPGVSSWFGFPVLVTRNFAASDLRGALEFKGIETRAIICGNIARQPGMALWPHRVPEPLPHADHVMQNGFSIGCHQGVTKAMCEYLEEVLGAFMANNA